MDYLTKAGILGIVFGLSVGFGIGLVVTKLLVETPEVQDDLPPDLNFFVNRFDRLEEGIFNSSLDPCFSFGGTWVLDANGNFVSQQMNFIGSEGVVVTRDVLPCVLPE